MQEAKAVTWLSRWERRGLAALLLLAVAFGVLVEVRSAFLTRRMGDLGVYVRGAWAVRTGHDLYEVTDDSGCHYNYPPLLPILATPLSDPPHAEDPSGDLSSTTTVAVRDG